MPIPRVNLNIDPRGYAGNIVRSLQGGGAEGAGTSRLSALLEDARRLRNAIGQARLRMLESQLEGEGLRNSALRRMTHSVGPTLMEQTARREARPADRSSAKEFGRAGNVARGLLRGPRAYLGDSAEQLQQQIGAIGVPAALRGLMQSGAALSSGGATDAGFSGEMAPDPVSSYRVMEGEYRPETPQDTLRDIMAMRSRMGSAPPLGSLATRQPPKGSYFTNAALGRFEKGTLPGTVPKTGPALVHKNEIIVSADQADPPLVRFLMADKARKMASGQMDGKGTGPGYRGGTLDPVTQALIAYRCGSLPKHRKGTLPKYQEGSLEDILKALDPNELDELNESLRGLGYNYEEALRTGAGMGGVAQDVERAQPRPRRTGVRRGGALERIRRIPRDPRFTDLPPSSGTLRRAAPKLLEAGTRGGALAKVEREAIEAAAKRARNPKVKLALLALAGLAAAAGGAALFKGTDGEEVSADILPPTPPAPTPGAVPPPPSEEALGLPPAGTGVPGLLGGTALQDIPILRRFVSPEMGGLAEGEGSVAGEGLRNILDPYIQIAKENQARILNPPEGSSRGKELGRGIREGFGTVIGGPLEFGGNVLEGLGLTGFGGEEGAQPTELEEPVTGAEGFDLSAYGPPDLTSLAGQMRGELGEEKASAESEARTLPPTEGQLLKAARHQSNADKLWDFLSREGDSLPPERYQAYVQRAKREQQLADVFEKQKEQRQERAAAKAEKLEDSIQHIRELEVAGKAEAEVEDVTQRAQREGEERKAFADLERRYREAEETLLRDIISGDVKEGSEGWNGRIKVMAEAAMEMDKSRYGRSGTLEEYMDAVEEEVLNYLER